MSYGYLYTPTALVHYNESVKWYAVRSIRAAENFVKEVDAGVKAICNKPFQFKNRYKNFREKSLKKYPFDIIYFIDEENETIVITTIYHHKRNPQKKYRR